MALLMPEALIADLQDTLRKRYGRPHPVRQLLLTGRLTKEQLQWWAKNLFHEFRNIHRFFGVRYQKCPVPELRRALLENMVEEEGGISLAANIRVIPSFGSDLRRASVFHAMRC